MVKDLKLAISGHKGVGKTTAAKYLASKHGFRIESFAGKLKSLSSKFYPFNDLHLNGNLKEEKFEGHDWTPRDFMIKLGAFMRYWEPDYWINSINISKGSVVIDDLRYLNEVEYLKSKGFKTIRINRFDKHNPYKSDLNDPSETQLDNYEFDYVIHDISNITLNDLYASLEHILGKLNE